MLTVVVGQREYTATRADSLAIGVEQAMLPVGPYGKGWELVSASVVGTTFFYWWVREL